MNKEELTSLFNTMSSAAKLKGNASIFEVDEAEDYINTTQTSEGQTLKQLGVRASDLFNFISALVQKNENNTTQVQSGVEALQQSYTPEEIEDLSIQTLTDDVRKARQIFSSQNENQGAVSDFVNNTKETFDTEFAASRINRFLMNEEFCAKMLELSKEGKLTEKEYLEAKINLIASMLPELKNSELKGNISKQIVTFGLFKDFKGKTLAEQERIEKELELNYLKEALRNLTPEELTVFINKVASLSDEEYKEQAPKLVEGLINRTIAKKELENKPVIGEKSEKVSNLPPREGSVEDIVAKQSGYRLMDFETVFVRERGVKYDSEAVMDYTAKEAQLQFLLGMHNKKEAIKSILYDATVVVEGNNKHGAPSQAALELGEQKLASSIIHALKNLYGQDSAKVKEVIEEILGKDSGVEVTSDEQGNFCSIEFSNNSLDSYTMVKLSQGLQQKLEQYYQTALGGKTLDDYSAEVADAYKKAYGERSAQNMADAFAQNQQEGVENTKAVVQGLGMVAMVAGQLIPVGGQAATALVMGGMATSTLGSVGVSALENYTKAGGPTEEDKKAMLQELGTSLALVGSGMGIGKGSEAIFRTLVMKNCPKLIAYATEVGVDATASLLADYAITGQIDLSGEGIAQLQSILVGILHAKGNFSSYLNTHARNVTTKPTNVTSKPRIDDLPYDSKANQISNKANDIDITETVSRTNDVDIVDMNKNGAENIGTNGYDINTINRYPLKSNPNAQLVEYSYKVSDGRVFKFMAAKGLNKKNYDYLVAVDINSKNLSTEIPKFAKYSDSTKFSFARLFGEDNKKNTYLKMLLCTTENENDLLKIISNKDLLNNRLNDIKDLSNKYNITLEDSQYLKGFFKIKDAQPDKYKKIMSSGIFNLIKEGKLKAKSLDRLGLNADLSPEMYSDLALLKSGKSIVPEFAEGTDLKTAFEQTKLGDAVEVGGKMYLNDGNSLIEWNMTKEKYLELFPPVQRFATAQGEIGDCHLVQTLGLAMHNPKARVEFLQSFTLKGDDVVVTVKGLEDYHGSETFTNGNIELPKGNKHIIGCKGMQMYEQTYARVALRENSSVDYPSIASVDNLMLRTESGQAAQTMADVFGQGYVAELFDLNITQTDGTKTKASQYAAYPFERVPIIYNGSRANIKIDTQQNNAAKLFVFDKFFTDFPQKTLALKNLSLETTETLLKHSANDNNYLISFGSVVKQGAATESPLLPEYNLVSNHAYSILGYDESTKMVKIGNPHAYGEVTEIPLETLHQYIQHLDFLKL